MKAKTSVLIAGNSITEDSVTKNRPDARVVGVLQDLALVEYVATEIPIDELVLDPNLSPRGESLDQWIARFNKAYPTVRITIGGSDSRPETESAPAKVVTSQTVVIWSPKGGVGKTFIATNLACATALVTKGNAALLDLDIYSGDVATYLDLADEPTLAQILPVLTGLRPDGLDRYVQRHAPSGLNVICGPQRLELSSMVTIDHVRNMISLAEKRWGLLYIDTPPDIASDVVGECIEAASSLILVTTQDVCALRQSKSTLGILKKLGFNDSSIFVVLNRGADDSLIPQKKVEEYLDRPLTAVIPDDRKTVEKSVFQGKPAVLFGKTEISLSLWHLLSQVSPGLPIPDGEKKQSKAKRRRLW